MQAYYLDIETQRKGQTVDPSVDSIITIQYQPIDLATGLPQGKITILKAWESSEEAIVSEFYRCFFDGTVKRDDFVPVGFSLHFEFEALLSKFKKYNLGVISCKDMYYNRKYLDIKPIIILLNEGLFSGARLDQFTNKASDGSVIMDFYQNKQYDKIEDYITLETSEFLILFQNICKNISKLDIPKKGAK